MRPHRELTMAIDKKHDEKVQDLPKTKVDADKAEQVKGGMTAVAGKLQK